MEVVKTFWYVLWYVKVKKAPKGFNYNNVGGADVCHSGVSPRDTL
jgi:hypothetical protein